MKKMKVIDTGLCLINRKEILAYLSVLDPTSFKIFFCLCMIAKQSDDDEEGLFKKTTPPVGYDDIRKNTGLSYSSVNSKLSDLESRGFIIKRAHAENGKQCKNSYRLCLS